VTKRIISICYKAGFHFCFALFTIETVPLSEKAGFSYRSLSSCAKALWGSFFPDDYDALRQSFQHSEILRAPYAKRLSGYEFNQPSNVKETDFYDAMRQQSSLLKLEYQSDIMIS